MERKPGNYINTHGEVVVTQVYDRVVIDKPLPKKSGDVPDIAQKQAQIRTLLEKLKK